MLTYVLKSYFSNIQVENPVAVLDQEEAKKFLTGKAEDKYAFFMKATELERVDRTYAETIDKVESLQGMLVWKNLGESGKSTSKWMSWK